MVMVPPRRRSTGGVQRAFDEARFGALGTLNLREGLPRGIEAERRAESWLRERQATGMKEVLIITGRGNASIGGVPVIREAVSRLLRRLQRAGVVKSTQEHTAGSFIVELASMRAMLEAPKRRKDRVPSIPDPPALGSLAPETRAMLRALAERNLDMLGIGGRPELVHAEMLQQFSRIAAALPAGRDREQQMQRALERLLADDPD